MTTLIFYHEAMDRNLERFDHESLETRAVRAGRRDLHELGVHAPPLDLSSTYPIDDLDQAGVSLESLAGGGQPLGNPVYARLHSPTVARFEEALAELEGTEEAVAFSSGMAALTACLLAASEDGRHAVAIRPLYGGSDHLLAGGLLGIDVTWTTPDGVAAALRHDTSLVILETPANPTLVLADLERVVADAGPVPVLVDSTFATPVLQRPAEQGAALVLHSGTKFLGGHGDVVAGVVATGAEWARRLRRVRVATGALLHPLGAYLLHRGLPTLPLRVERAQATARVLAERLAGHPEVERVFYPGLPGGDPLGLIGRQMSGPGALVSFEVAGGYPAARALLEGLRGITPAVSLGSTDTLIQHPAGLTHRVVDEGARRITGISEGLVRLSVGLEDPDDLWADLDRGLDHAWAGAAMAAEERLVG